jgi:AcrR family transcriptional regulator
MLLMTWCPGEEVTRRSGQTATDIKTRILDAADEIFVRHGIDGARMQEIADHAGVNKALLYYHFRSKAGLARAVGFHLASSIVPGLLQMMTFDLSLDGNPRCFRATAPHHTTPFVVGRQRGAIA